MDIFVCVLVFVEFNVCFNGVMNIEFWFGSMFELVVGEVFDLIVFNFFFVIILCVDGVLVYEYCDGGLVGDVLVEQFVWIVFWFLMLNGIVQLFGNWELKVGVVGFVWFEVWVLMDFDFWVIQ